MDLNDTTMRLTLHPKIKKTYFSLTFSAINQSKLFWCELYSCGGIGRKDLCLLSNTMEVNGALNVVFTAPKSTFDKLNSEVSLQKS